jgi:hypothetical protein
MYAFTRFACSATARTFSIPFVARIRDLSPISNHDSIPGAMALKPLRRSRFRFSSFSSESDVSATKVMRPGGTTSSIASR